MVLCELVNNYMLAVDDNVIVYSADCDTNKVGLEPIYSGCGNKVMFSCYGECRVEFVRALNCVLAIYLNPKDVVECVKGTEVY